MFRTNTGLNLSSALEKKITLSVPDVDNSYSNEALQCVLIYEKVFLDVCKE